MSTSPPATSNTSQTTAASPSDSPTISTTSAPTTTMASTTPTTPSSTTSAPSSQNTPSATTGTVTGTTPTMSEASNTISSTSDPPSSTSNDSTSTSTSSSTTQSQTLTSTSTSTTQPPTSTTSTTSTSTSTSTSTTPTSTSTSTTPTSTTESTSTTRTEETSTASSQPPTQATVTNETTHTNEVVTTLESTVFVTTTNSAGSTFTSAPSEVTSFLTSTNSNGGVVTVTQIGVNPTLSPNNDNDDGSSFFHNTGAVAGVFVLVGLAIASILLWILFAVRRRRRTRRLEHDTAVNATLAAVGFHRAPLEDEDDDHGATGNLRYGSPEMAQHSPRSSIPTIPTTGRTSAYLNDVNIESGFNPYAEMGAYAPPQTPPLTANARNGSDQRISHSASHSAGSYEPLLASFYQNEASRGPTPPLRNPQRNADKSPVLAQNGLPGERSSAASSYSTQDTGDDRLDPDLRRRLKDDNDAEKGDLRDDEDYSRPVLGVRNIPDGVSVLSQ